MTKGGYIVSGIAVTAGGAVVGGITGCGAGRRGYDSAIAVTQCVAAGSAAGGAGLGIIAGSGFPTVAGSGYGIAGIAVAAGAAGIGGIAVLCAGGGGYNGIVAVTRRLTAADTTDRAGAGFCTGGR